MMILLGVKRKFRYFYEQPEMGEHFVFRNYGHFYMCDPSPFG